MYIVNSSLTKLQLSLQGGCNYVKEGGGGHTITSPFYGKGHNNPQPFEGKSKTYFQ